MPALEHPKVFISYSHDSQEHGDRVLTLSDRLRADGIDCHIDQYEVSPPEGWQRWMVNQIEDADFVLVVCTENYERRFRGREERGKGLGAQWEGAIITQELYDAENHNTTFIPVFFSPDHSAYIPIVLHGATYYDLNTEEGYEVLYRRLTNQYLIQKPELGKIRPMPPLARKQPSQETLFSDTRTATPEEDAKRVSDGKGNVAIACTPVTVPQPPKESSTTRLPFAPEMILIPAGEFLMGSDPQKDRSAQDDEQPQHLLYLPDYYLAKTPVTNAQYAAFMQAIRYTQRRYLIMGKPPRHWIKGKPPSGKEDHPVVHVCWYDALAYCRWLSEVTGKSYSLPSEAEWEKAARGADGRIYPWGDHWDATRCNSKEGDQGNTTPVGAYPEGASPYRLLDMTGNVWEWTRSVWGHYPYPTGLREQARYEKLTGERNAPCVLRGGALNHLRRHMRCAYRHWGRSTLSDRSFGFRVVMHPAS
jgi:formylglycine-generating enzyme required for sulfatase activity